MVIHERSPIPEEPATTELRAMFTRLLPDLTLSLDTSPPAEPHEAEVAEDVSQDGETGVPWKPQREELLVMISLAVISFIVSLDATIIVPALSTIARDLGVSATGAFWIGTCFLLTCAVFQPFISALSDIFGRQQLLLPSVISFTIGTITAAVAKNLRTIIVGRCIQGIGGGGIVAMSMVIFTDIVPLRHRPKWYGIIQGAWALGTILGPLIGGLFVQHSTWRWIFYLNLPFCGIGLVMVTLMVRLETRISSFKEKLLRVDWFGGFLFIASMTSFLIAISWGGVQEPWGSFRTLVPLIFGVLGVVATLAWEYWGAKEPFLRRSLFYCWSALAAYCAAVCQGIVLFCGLYYIALYMEAVQLKSPTATGVAFFPVVVTLVPASIVVGVVVSRIGRFRWAVRSGFAMMVLASGLMITWDVGTSTAAWAVILIIQGVGQGLALNALNFATQAISRASDAAAAAALYAFSRQFGMALGVATGGAVFQNVMRHSLVGKGLPAGIAKDAEGYISVLKALPVDSELRLDVLKSYAQGLKGVWIFMTAICVLGFVLSLCIGRFSLDKELETEHVLDSNRSSWRSSWLTGGNRESRMIANDKEKRSSMPLYEGV